MADAQKPWEIYERMIARLMSLDISADLCVTPNARLRGRISGTLRQIDVLIDARHETDNSRRIIVDAKTRKRKIDVTHVEAFKGVMEDVGATHGYLVCSAGHTEAAEKRAQMAVSICLVPLDHIPNFDPTAWPRCKSDRCESGRVFWDGFPAFDLSVVERSPSAAPARHTLTFVQYVGKCDRCGRFHVYCETCANILSFVEDDDSDIGARCKCHTPWFWIASVEVDEHGEQSAELHAVLATGSIMTVDRRPYKGGGEGERYN